MNIPSFSFKLNKIVVFPAASRPTITILDSLSLSNKERIPAYERKDKAAPILMFKNIL